MVTPEGKTSMKVEKSDRGFEWIGLGSYANKPVPCRLVGQSSAIGDYDDSFERPGSSFLWIGDHDGIHHLNREQVTDLVAHMQAWLQTGSLEIVPKPKSKPRPKLPKTAI